MGKYVAFLRGINVGGNKVIKMEELRNAFEAVGFANVKTLLASGNVLFDASEMSESALAREIEGTLEKTFGHKIGALTRTIEVLQSLADQNPFSGITITPQTRLYVTFLSEKPSSGLKIPYRYSEGNFKIIRASASEVCSVLTLSSDTRTVDLMSILEKEFGKSVTTRNWNTIKRVLKASQGN